MTVLSVPAELTSACAHVLPGGPADAVAGKPASYVAAPASTEEAAAVLQAAAILGLTVVPRGRGSRLAWGSAPASCDLIIDTGNLDQIIEHTAGDLVASVQAGVRLDDLATVLAAAGQRLAIDPPDHSGTVGGLIATGAAGPLRYRYGSPRDLLIGITVIRADGTVARAGGKVVKNVAGYDIGKLFAGSFGTLGLITEATFRLHPLPESTAWVRLDCPDPASAAAAVQAIADSPVTPSAIELDWPSRAAPLTIAALLEGDSTSVADRAGRLGQLLERATAGPSPAHPKLAGDRPGTRLRVAFWTGQLARVLAAIRAAAQEHGLDPAIGGSAGAGVLDVAVGEEAMADAVAGFVADLRASLKSLSTGTVLPATASTVVLDAPAAVRDAVDMWGPVQSLELMRAVKDQFDPEHRMAPGRLPGGI
jgi:glycolate oxidase FAD binding subunit